MIELEEGDAPAVGRPLVAGAHVQLFGIDPVEVAVQHQLAAAQSQWSFRAALRRHQPEIVLMDERHPLAIGRKLRVAHALLRRRKRFRFLGCQVMEEKPPGAGEQNLLRVGRPHVGRHRVAQEPFLLALVMDTFVGGRQFGQLFVAY